MSWLCGTGRQRRPRFPQGESRHLTANSLTGCRRALPPEGFPPPPAPLREPTFPCAGPHELRCSRSVALQARGLVASSGPEMESHVWQLCHPRGARAAGPELCTSLRAPHLSVGHWRGLYGAWCTLLPESFIACLVTKGARAWRQEVCKGRALPVVPAWRSGCG